MLTHLNGLVNGAEPSKASSSKRSARRRPHPKGLFLAAFFVFAPTARADRQSEIFLRNALHFYSVHNYAKAKGYFTAVLSTGSTYQKRIARQYLAKSVFARRQTPPPVRHESVNPPAELEGLEEPPPEEARENPSESGETPSIFRPSGYLREEVAARTEKPVFLSKLRTVGYAAATGDISESVSYKLSGRLWYDGVYELTDHYPRPVRNNQKTDGRVRDAYLDVSHENWDLRVGNQQIVWGEAMGIFYADVVNAKDLREFVLPDFEFIRIPELATDLEYTLGDFHAEAIWLPTPEMDIVGRPGSEFAPSFPVIPGFDIAFVPEEQPSNKLSNSEFGGRLAYRAGGWDLGVFYLRTWNKEPVYQRTVTPGVLLVQPTHPRLTVGGFTATKELEGYVLKAESVFNNEKPLITTDPLSPTGVVRKNQWDYLISADHRFGSHLDVSLQLGQRYINQYTSDIYLEKRTRSTATLFVRWPLLDDRLEPSVLAIRDLSANDDMIRPRLAYKWSAHWSTSVGCDLFHGPQSTPFGLYTGHDRAYMEAQLSF